MDYVTGNNTIAKEPWVRITAAILAYDVAIAKLKTESSRKEKKNHVSI